MTVHISKEIIIESVECQLVLIQMQEQMDNDTSLFDTSGPLLLLNTELDSLQDLTPKSQFTPDQVKFTPNSEVEAEGPGWDDFTIETTLGEGGFGKVYKVFMKNPPERKGDATGRSSTNQKGDFSARQEQRGISSQDLNIKPLGRISKMASRSRAAPLTGKCVQGKTNISQTCFSAAIMSKDVAPQQNQAPPNRQAFVIKEIMTDLMTKEQALTAMEEIHILGQLNSPYIVTYIDSFIQDTKVNIIMEFCDHGDLQSWLSSRKKHGQSTLPENTIWRFFIQICLGVHYLHGKLILHRDLKALNIFITKDNQIKIGDLGVAKIKQQKIATSPSTQMNGMGGNLDITNQEKVGTPFYLAPELWEDKPYTEKSDVWSLGVILYELCTFTKPFIGPNMEALREKVLKQKYTPLPPSTTSKDLSDLITKLLKKNPAQRPTVKEILAFGCIKSKAQLLKIQLPVLPKAPSINAGIQSNYQTVSQSKLQLQQQRPMPSSSSKANVGQVSTGKDSANYSSSKALLKPKLSNSPTQIMGNRFQRKFTIHQQKSSEQMPEGLMMGKFKKTSNMLRHGHQQSPFLNNLSINKSVSQVSFNSNTTNGSRCGGDSSNASHSNLMLRCKPPATAVTSSNTSGVFAKSGVSSSRTSQKNLKFQQDRTNASYQCGTIKELVTNEFRKGGAAGAVTPSKQQMIKRERISSQKYQNGADRLLQLKATKASGTKRLHPQSSIQTLQSSQEDLQGLLPQNETPKIMKSSTNKPSMLPDKVKTIQTIDQPKLKKTKSSIFGQKPQATPKITLNISKMKSPKAQPLLSSKAFTSSSKKNALTKETKHCEGGANQNQQLHGQSQSMDVHGSGSKTKINFLKRPAESKLKIPRMSIPMEYIPKVCEVSLTDSRQATSRVGLDKDGDSGFELKTYFNDDIFNLSNEDLKDAVNFNDDGSNALLSLDNDPSMTDRRITIANIDDDDDSESLTLKRPRSLLKDWNTSNPLFSDNHRYDIKNSILGSANLVDIDEAGTLEDFKTTLMDENDIHDDDLLEEVKGDEIECPFGQAEDVLDEEDEDLLAVRKEVLEIERKSKFENRDERLEVITGLKQKL